MIACGIYAIKNRVTGECYIGQAKNFASRFLSHRLMLRKGTHHSRRLQASFNTHGEPAFAFEVLERCEPADLDDKEHAWMLRVRPCCNACVPDYDAIAKGRASIRLRNSRNPVNREPNRYVCACGKLKSLQSKQCSACADVLRAQMRASGYLPERANQGFEVEGRYGTRPEPLSHRAVASSYTACSSRH